MSNATAETAQTEQRPYRLNVGIALFNAAGRVWIGKRRTHSGPEIILPGRDWQMPQGGIDPEEDPHPAARRELFEETGITSVEYLGETPDWRTYEFPPYAGPPHHLARFRGQRQKWFAFRFTGEEAEIDISVEHGASNGEPEFSAWRWEHLARVPELVVPFKSAIYAEVVTAFEGFSRP